jgi:hypothetical protein
VPAIMSKRNDPRVQSTHMGKEGPFVTRAPALWIPELLLMEGDSAIVDDGKSSVCSQLGHCIILTVSLS